LRASAVKEGFLRITGRVESGPPTANSGLTCRGRDGNGLGVLVGNVLDLESDGFGTRSDVWLAWTMGGRGQMDTLANSTTYGMP